MILVNDVITYLETNFPKSLAYDWDNIGLNIGSIHSEIKKILITLDVTESVVNEAIKTGANLIVTHHPFIFTPLKSINIDSRQGRIIKLCIKNDISIYAMHTNYDIADDGMNDVLAKKLGIKNTKPLTLLKHDSDYGIGRIGELDQRMDIFEYINLVKMVLNIETANLVEAGSKEIKTVAIVGGSGSKSLEDAKKMGADLFITGDVTYHTALDAIDFGVSVLDVGHFVEVVMLSDVAMLLGEKFGTNLVVCSEMGKNPFKNV